MKNCVNLYLVELFLGLKYAVRKFRYEFRVFFFESHVFFEIITRNTVQPWSPKKQLTIET
jgi:hypothetical protein